MQRHRAGMHARHARMYSRVASIPARRAAIHARAEALHPRIGAIVARSAAMRCVSASSSLADRRIAGNHAPCSRPAGRMPTKIVASTSIAGLFTISDYLILRKPTSMITLPLRARPLCSTEAFSRRREHPATSHVHHSGTAQMRSVAALIFPHTPSEREAT